ncbi:phage tail protein [Lonepinella koalarum]|uniref:tail fiber protein n=1 Tax=Lonepinella koalarum TaxID=53417 RepID=UPI0011E3BEA9|nr:tail fiber protein [Lonepinella koalarum]TYG34149.1 phage tail protein [Lonepinella koalarum]
MANLKETAQWETGIYQLETSDPVMGGEDGVDNRQAKQLANRTAYLKEQVESLGSDKANANHSHAIADITNLQTTLNSKANATDLTSANSNFTTLRNILVGVPIPHPLSSVPTGCLVMNGQSFNKTLYPVLATKYPSGVLPDLRGEFIRGWDNGRGVDSGRSILSTQSESFKSHSHYLMTTTGSTNPNANNTFGLFNDNYAQFYNSTMPIFKTEKNAVHNRWIAEGFEFKTYEEGGDETHPRNIAFHYICLAA